MNKFPSIEHYRQLNMKVKSKVQYNHETDELDESVELPTLVFMGTVKTDGTHGDIVFDATHQPQCQSRNNVLTRENPNTGFWNYVNDIPADELASFFVEIEKVCQNEPDFQYPIMISGEWCGEKIQKGVGISELKRFFVFYNICMGPVESRTWVDITKFQGINLNTQRIFNILDFECYEINIDMNDPASSLPMLEQITNNVGQHCPVARRVAEMDGHVLKNTIGEGVVWKCISPGYNSSKFWFKIKTEKHQVTKGSNTISPEKVASIMEFLDKTVTDNRLLQGVRCLKEDGILPDSPNYYGKLQKWVYHDILKEESDVLAASALTAKDISKDMNRQVTNWLNTTHLHI